MSSHGKVRKFVLLLTVMYACFAVLDDSPAMEPDPASAHAAGLCFMMEMADDATPWLSLNLDHHRTVRSMAKQLADLPSQRTVDVPRSPYGSIKRISLSASTVNPDVRLITGIYRI